LDLNSNEWKESRSIVLNNREKDILVLSVQGLTMDKIAAKLFLSVDTIKFHKRNIFKKLNVKNIAEAIAVAMDLAII
jgi:DNA-binding CsgD family transcriptional regulator